MTQPTLAAGEACTGEAGREREQANDKPTGKERAPEPRGPIPCSRVRVGSGQVRAACAAPLLVGEVPAVSSPKCTSAF